MSRNLYYYKFILRKVSFNSILFRKELNKAYENLSYEDTLLLNKWVKAYAKKNNVLQDLN
tara:strand:- start:1489 stop:1668 length:180 start_codon:yes stop_codon:yes gene_type:complete